MKRLSKSKYYFPTMILSDTDITSNWNLSPGGRLIATMRQQLYRHKPGKDALFRRPKLIQHHTIKLRHLLG